MKHPFIEVWNTSKYIIFSVSISIVIIAWDIVFVEKHFPVNTWLAYLMMAQVEISYIVLPYMIDYTADRLNKIMRVVFFIASMTPAALGITDQFIDKMLLEIKTEPTIPVMPKEDKTIDKEMNRLKYLIWKDIDKEKSKAKLEELEKKKNEYRDALSKFNKATEDYPQKKAEYDEYKKKGNITWFFDVVMLFLGFIIMVSLQIMNGYASTKGAQRKRPKKKTTKTTIEQPTTEPEPIGPSWGKENNPWNQ